VAGNAIFEVEKPFDKYGIGFDALAGFHEELYDLYGK